MDEVQQDSRARPRSAISTKSADAFSTISEVADRLDVPQHVLRFWETKFPHVKPLKRGGGRRYYRPDDVDLLEAIRALLYVQGYTIRGVQKLFREQGLKSVLSQGQAHRQALPAAAASRPAEPPKTVMPPVPVSQNEPAAMPRPANLAVAAVIEGVLTELADIRDLLLKSAGAAE